MTGVDMGEHDFDDLDPELFARLQQADEADAADDDGHGDSDDEGGYRQPRPSRAQKRIKQEIDRRKALEAQLAEERAMREQYEAELAEHRKSQEEGLKARADDLKKQRDAALEEGDLELATKLGDEYHLLQYDLRERERAKNEKPAVRKEEPQDEGIDNDRPAGKGPTKAAQRWMRRNSEWINANSEASRERLEKAIEIERELLGMGYTTDDDDLYLEIDRRLAGGGRRQQRGSAFAGLDQDGGEGSGGRPRRLTESDKRAMRAMNLRPENPKHREAWLKRNDPLQDY